MLGNRRDNALLALSVLGIVVSAASVTLRPWPVAMLLTVGGVVLAYGAMAVLYRTSDGTFSLFGFGRVDERKRRIEAKSARNAFFLILAFTQVYMISAQYRPWELSGTTVAIIVGSIAIVALIGFGGLYDARM